MYVTVILDTSFTRCKIVAKSHYLGITHVNPPQYLCTRYECNKRNWFVFNSIGLGRRDEYERGGLHVSPPSFLIQNTGSN